MKNASLWFVLVLQSFLPSFSHFLYIFPAFLSSFCFGFFLGLSPLVFILTAVFLALFLSSVSSCFFLSWSWKFPGNVLKVSVSTQSLSSDALPSHPSLRRVLDFGLMQFSWTLISDPAFCAHQLSVHRTNVFCCIWKFIFRELDNLVFFLLFTSKCWNPVPHSLSFSEWFWMLVWNFYLQCSSLVFEKEKHLFPRFFNSSSIHLFIISKLICFSGVVARCFPGQWQADMAGCVTLNAIPRIPGYRSFPCWDSGWRLFRSLWCGSGTEQAANTASSSCLHLRRVILPAIRTGYWLFNETCCRNWWLFTLQ